MGSSKKKDKKKKKKRTRDSGDDSPGRSRDSERKRDDDRKKDSYRKNIPQTEEYVYDYSGQEIVGGSRDISPSPEQDLGDKGRYSERNKEKRYERGSNRRDRSRSPLQNDYRKRELTPPPLPPGVDWPFEGKTRQSNDKVDWESKDEQNRDRDYQDEVDRKYREKKKEEMKRNEAPDTTSTKESLSLSIEETNKLREKLGLKPLKMDSDSKDGSKEVSYADREDVHKPATNISEKKTTDKMREKMEAIREKRRIHQKLQKVKGLGDDDDPVIDSAAAWVVKSRIKEKEKELAAIRAKMLEEMDEEFGISSLIEETVGNIKKEPFYGSKDLKGLMVQHKGNSFAEGSDVILTLEDKAILDENNDDVLINVNIAEDERTKKNVENRRKKPGYKAYDEVDEETGMLKVRGVLDKYDEEIEGRKKESFKLDHTGKAEMDGETEMDKIRATLKAQQVSLEMSAPQLAREYYTEEELVKFKKPRKKIRKVRKRQVLKADDLLKINVADSTQDRGSRKQKTTKPSLSQGTQGEEDMDIVTAVPDELDYYVAVSQHEETPSFVEDDEAEQELQLALQRSRRTKEKKGHENDEADAALEKIALEVLNKPKEKDMEMEMEMEQPTTSRSSKKKGKGMIVLDSTSEFCRTLGEIPSLGPPSQPKREEVLPDDDVEMEIEKSSKGGWEQVEINKAKLKKVDAKEDEDEDVLESEPIPNGIVATLNLANMKGYLKEGREKVRKFDPLNLPETKAEVDFEKLRDEEKNKYSRGGYDRDRYDPYAFKDKSNYKPDIKLEYVDNKGRQLNQKEAFRLLSHKFHGKGSGKLKTEKRAKKILEEKKLQKMSSIDTPLNTASMFKDRQKQSQSAYLVLSGGGKNLLTGGATLKK